MIWTTYDWPVERRQPALAPSLASPLAWALVARWETPWGRYLTPRCLRGKSRNGQSFSRWGNNLLLVHEFWEQLTLMFFDGPSESRLTANQRLLVAFERSHASTLSLRELVWPRISRSEEDLSLFSSPEWTIMNSQETCSTSCLRARSSVCGP